VSPDELAAAHRRYNTACDAHEFGRIGEVRVTADNLGALDQLR
jgi:hypothetical protein